MHLLQLCLVKRRRQDQVVEPQLSLLLMHSRIHAGDTRTACTRATCTEEGDEDETAGGRIPCTPEPLTQPRGEAHCSVSLVYSKTEL